jgi:hypothetical protein
MRRPALAIAAVAAAGLLTAGCSSSPAKRSGSPTAPSSSAPAATSVPSTTTAGNSSTSAPPTTAGGPGRCAPASLKGSFTLVPGGASAGHVEAQIVLTNTGTSPCHMFGYIGMQLLDASGVALPTDVVRVPGAEQEVTLGPGASAVSYAQFSSTVPGAGDSQTGTCQPVAKSTEVTPPDDTQFLVVPGPNSPVCERGTIQVQPVQASAGNGQ